jgi:hypothetical protein
VPQLVAEAGGGLPERTGALGQVGVPGRLQHQPNHRGSAGLLQADAHVDRLAAEGVQQAPGAAAMVAHQPVEAGAQRRDRGQRAAEMVGPG